jgi:hypothetical protein
MLVRQQWSPTGPNSYHFEQSFSADFGKTWVSNFTADLVRETCNTRSCQPSRGL